MNTLLSASGPIVRATLMASLWSSSSDGPPQSSQIVTWMPPCFWPDATLYAARQCSTSTMESKQLSQLFKSRPDLIEIRETNPNGGPSDQVVRVSS